MTKLYSLVIVCVLAAAVGCRSASKSYQKGDYTDAIEKGVKKLQKDPTDYETRDLVQKSYNYTVSQHEDQIRMLSTSNGETRDEKIYQEYQALQNLYTSIHEYPAVAQMIKTRDYSSELNTYRERAAQIHLDRAATWMHDGTKEAYREAFKEYDAALSYRPDDFVLRRKRDSVYDKAVTKVVIASMQNYAGSQYGSPTQLANFQSNVIRTLSSNMNNGFVRFYTENEARTRNINADQVIELVLSGIVIGQPNDVVNTREISKDVVVKETVYRPDSVIKQWATVKAVITTTKRTLLSQGDLFITLRDTKGITLWSDRFTGQHKWETQFSSFSGDERALADADKTEVNQTRATPPSQDQIMSNLMQNIQGDLTGRLRGYYTKYN